MKRIVVIICLAIPFAVKAQLADSAQRLVHVQGALNFRDVGGYKTKDGKEVKWGKVYRSADVSRLTDSDLQLLEEKKIHTVVDFRGVKEAQQAPDRMLPGTDYTLCPAGSDSLPGVKDLAGKMKNDSFLIGFYTNTEVFGARYKPLFDKLMALPEGESVMYHCTGGRDRTGMATALFLYALGVSQQTIEADFVASNVYLAPMNAGMYKKVAEASGMNEEQVKQAFLLKPELLRAMFAAIEQRYGSMDKFFEQELGIGKKELRELRAKYTS